MTAALAEVFPAGEFLADELEARGWTQTEFAAILDRPAQFVSEIISGKKEITRESAAQIGAALGTSAQMWLTLQDQYLLSLREKDAKAKSELDAVRRRARLNDKCPVTALKKAGILTGSTLDELEDEVRLFFELDSLDEEPHLAAAAKRSNHGEPLSSLQTAWLYMIRHASRESATTGTFSRGTAEEVGAAIPSAIKTPNDFVGLPKMLAEAGIRLVHVPALRASKIDGCAMIVDETRVIGLSGRGKRLDKVLFALLHEIAHLTHGHEEDGSPIVERLDAAADLVDSAEAARENQANETAARWLLPEGLPALPTRLNGSRIIEAAADLDIAPIVLVGYLQHLGRVDWRTSLTKDAPTVGDIMTTWRCNSDTLR